MNRENLLIIAQAITVIVLGTLVALGKDSAITDGLLAVSGSITGVGLLEKVRAKSSKPPGE